MSDEQLRIPDADRLEAALVAHADGAFGEKDRERAERLLAGNPELRARVERIRREQAALRAALAGEAAPLALDEVRRGRIALAARQAARQPQGRSALGLWLLAAACLCLAVLTLLPPAVSPMRMPVRTVGIAAPPPDGAGMSSAVEPISVPPTTTAAAWDRDEGAAFDGSVVFAEPTAGEADRFAEAGRGTQGRSVAGGSWRAPPAPAAPAPVPGRAPAPRVVDIAAEEAVGRPIVTELDLPVEEIESEDEVVVAEAKGREETVAATETGGAGDFMAIGAGGGAAGSFGQRAAESTDGDDAERHVFVLRRQRGRDPVGDRGPTGGLANELAPAAGAANGVDGQRAQRAKDETVVVDERREALAKKERESVDKLQMVDLIEEALPAEDEPARLAGRIDPQRIDAIQQRADQAFERGDYATSEVLAEQLLRIDRDDPAAQRLLVAARRAQETVRHNPWTLAVEDRHSTFALDTDVASFALARRHLGAGVLPPPAAVRIEGFVNAFDHHYPATDGGTFQVHAQAAPAPFGPADSVLLKLGVKAAVVGRDQQRPAHLVFVIDASGSMGAPDRLPLVRRGIALLLDQLGPEDRVSVVATAAAAHLVVDHQPASAAAAILGALDGLQPAGGTNLLAGLELGYARAAQHFRSGSVHQVLLCSDGVATIGPDRAETVLAQVARWRVQGIACSTIGVGAGAYDDRMLARLAKDGDGHYHYLDSDEAVREIFVERLGATRHVVARDAKIQVAFDPERVRRYRLLGYEQREIADVDFRNDAVDAGEVGSGQSATALYELELVPGTRDLGSVALRWREPAGESVHEATWRLRGDLPRALTVSEAPRFHLAACAAEAAEILRGSPHAADGDLAAVAGRLDAVVAALPLDRRIAELRDLCRRAAGLLGSRR